MVVVRVDPVDVVPPYLAICDRIAALVRVPGWSDVDAGECLSLIREACAGSPISAVISPQDFTRQVADQIRVEAGLAELASVD